MYNHFEAIQAAVDSGGSSLRRISRQLFMHMRGSCGFDSRQRIERRLVRFSFFFVSLFQLLILAFVNGFMEGDELRAGALL
jgi:hypothetical protein